MRVFNTFPYSFQIVGDPTTKSVMIEKIVSDKGMFDTTTLTYKKFKSLNKLLEKCQLHRNHNDGSEFDYDDLLKITNHQIEVSGNWTITPSNSENNDINVTIVSFRVKEDMEKYFVYSLLGSEYSILI